MKLLEFFSLDKSICTFCSDLQSFHDFQPSSAYADPNARPILEPNYAKLLTTPLAKNMTFFHLVYSMPQSTGPLFLPSILPMSLGAALSSHFPAVVFGRELTVGSLLTRYTCSLPHNSNGPSNDRHKPGPRS